MYEFFKKGGHRTTSAWRSPSEELFDAALWTPPGFQAATLTQDPASGGALVVPQYLPGIQPLPTKRLLWPIRLTTPSRTKRKRSC